MAQLRAFMVALANIMLGIIVVVATIAGLVGGWNGGGLAGAIGAAIMAFIVSCAAMSGLAVLLDIRDLLKRIELQGGSVRGPGMGAAD